MRLFCWYCSKSVTTELPDNAIFRALAICPECIEQGLDQQVNIGIHKLLVEARDLLHDAHMALVSNHEVLPNRIDAFLDASANFLGNYKVTNT